jgi:guanylate kinase
MNKVFAIIGPPASGKSAIVRQLLNDHRIGALVSHTTRPPQDGERDGVDYYFVDKATFSRLQFVEKVNYSGHYYGLSKDEVLNKMNRNPISVIDIGMTGFGQLKKLLGERLESIYILVDKDTIITRCFSLGQDLAEIEKKIEYAEKQGEFDNWRLADHVVKNSGSLDVAVRQVLAIMDCCS